MVQEHSTYPGWVVTGFPETTIRRGEIVYDNGKWIGGLDEGSVNCYAEKRTRTSTPLRALEPESSASANSAISAKDFKSMFFDL